MDFQNSVKDQQNIQLTLSLLKKQSEERSETELDQLSSLIKEVAFFKLKMIS